MYGFSAVRIYEIWRSGFQPQWHGKSRQGEYEGIPYHTTSVTCVTDIYDKVQ